jgi:hypothetical protein
MYYGNNRVEITDFSKNSNSKKGYFVSNADKLIPELKNINAVIQKSN